MYFKIILNVILLVRRYAVLSAVLFKHVITHSSKTAIVDDLEVVLPRVSTDDNKLNIPLTN